MKAEDLTAMETDELIDLRLLHRLCLAEEEVMVQAELSVRDLTQSQRDIVRTLFPLDRRLYNYRACSLNGSAQ